MKHRALGLVRGMTFVLVCGAGLAQAVTPSFQGLGFLAGGANYSTGLGVSGDGQVPVGMAYSAASPGHRAFKWTSGGGMVSLGLVPGQDTSYGYDANLSGTVVVGRANLTGFRWTQATGTMVVCGDLPGGNSISEAQAVNADGTVVVGFSGSTPAGGGGFEAFRWTVAGGTVGIGDFPGGSFDSEAHGVSADGTVVVGWGTAVDQFGNSYLQAFRWTQADGMVSIGDLPGGGTRSKAYGVSADGLVVVGESNSTASGSRVEAFRWTIGGMQGLGFLSTSSTKHSAARATSGDGRVVVGDARSPTSSYEAFIWTQADGMRTIKDVLTNDYGLDLTGWNLWFAHAVSDDGTVIIGEGTNPSNDLEAWMAVIPAPVCAGDVNGDGATNVADFGILAGSFGDGPGATSAQGDLSGDGFVDVWDFNILAAGFGCGS